MKSLHYIGLYLITIFAVLFIWSIWQVKHGSGHADFSFIFFIPFAIGLLRSRRWAILGTGLLGIISSSLIVVIAVVRSISGLQGLELRLGPFQISNPSIVAIWIFACVFVLVIGAPMATVIFLQKNARAYA